MIAKSDLLILVLSASALAAGIVRWQHNLSAVPVVTVPASARAPAGDVLRADAVNGAREPVLDASGVATPAGTAVDALPTVRRISVDGTDAPDAPRVVSAPAPVTPAAPEADTAIDADAIGEPLYGEYRVRSGDYLGRIAQRFGTTVATLRELNGIRGSTIQVGQRIRYPQPAN